MSCQPSWNWVAEPVLIGTGSPVTPDNDVAPVPLHVGSRIAERTAEAPLPTLIAALASTNFTGTKKAVVFVIWAVVRNTGKRHADPRLPIFAEASALTSTGGAPSTWPNTGWTVR